MATKKDNILSAALDFGTTHSGYAFSFKHDYEKDPLKISANPFLVNGFTGPFSTKAPTCVLLDPKQKFVAFGHDAENIYSELALNENHYDYYFFKGFKRVLYEKGHISKSILIKDDNGKEAPVLDLFAHVIRYLKSHLLSAMDTERFTVNNNDIHWVLPVPAIWTDSAKEFMREAANKAGILTEQLTMCLEPEAASLSCQLIPSTKLMGSPITQPFLSLRAGVKFMIIDLGGKSAEINIYQKQSDGTLKELHKPTRGPWGGDNVNEAFERMIIKIFGACRFQRFKNYYNGEYLDMHRQLEIKKRLIKPEFNSQIRIKVSLFLLELFQDETDEHIEDIIQQMQYSNKMTWLADKLGMEADLFKTFFRKPVDMLVEHLRQLMTEDNHSDVSTLLMVGGFSKSPMMYEAVLNAFPGKRVLVPDDADLAVLRGAVLLGHQSNAVLKLNPPGLL